MSPVVVVLLLLAGLSEAAGRDPAAGGAPARHVAAARGRAAADRRRRRGRRDRAVAADRVGPWPSWRCPLRAAGAGRLAWTPGLVAPLLLAAVLAFPLLGPLLHLLLLVGVGAGLVGPLAAATGLGWWAAAGCVAVAGVGLGRGRGGRRRLVVRHQRRERAPEAIA